MEEIVATIKTIESKNGQGPKGPWTRYTFTMEDGKLYSTFDSKIGESFNPGETVKMHGEVNGKYWNMKTMELTSEAPKSNKEEGIIAELKAIIKKYEC